MNTDKRFYGCWNRIPIVTFGKHTCQYTLTAAGKADPRCVGCKEKVDA